MISYGFPWTAVRIARGVGAMEWNKPEVTEQPVGLEVTSYLPAELEQD
jgi:coenzyme PQQ precursor peptide PqqA